MSAGLLTGRRCLSLILVLVLAAAAPVVLTGCGGGDQEETVPQQKPQALVPEAAVDSVALKVGDPSGTESVYQAGTLTEAGGVTDDPVATEPVAEAAEAELKAVPVENKAAAAPAETRPSPSVSSGTGSYGLQLGSFSNPANARRQADRISALGYSPVIEESDLGGQTYHRVMLLGIGDMSEASRLGEHIHSELGIAYLVRRGN